MSKIEIRKINLNNIVGIKNLIKYKETKNLFKNNFRTINKKYFKESKSIKSVGSIIKKENEKKKFHENQNFFNKTFNNKSMLQRKKTNDASFKLNKIIEGYRKKYDSESNKEINNDNEGKSELKKIIKDFSSISNESTMYKTKKKFFSSTQLNNNSKNIAYIDKYINRRRFSYYKGRKIIRSLSANNLLNNLTQNNNNLFSGSQFITALKPLKNKRNSSKKMSDNESSKSFFFKKIKDEKKFLTYFDIKKIYFLDKKVYKPNKEFENNIIKLKKNNSSKFIINFNLDSYKMTVLNLFQKHVAQKNYEIMKKNFDLICKAWYWNDKMKCHVKKKIVEPISQTEREILYNQLKIERENRIKSRNINNNRESRSEESDI